MKSQQKRTSHARYLINLVQAGTAGAVSAHKEADIPSAWKMLLWAPAAIGALAGASTASLNTNRRSGYRALVGGLVGTAVGLGCGFALASRGLTGVAARGAMRKMDAVRDARWLELNPIDYA